MSKTKHTPGEWRIGRLTDVGNFNYMYPINAESVVNLASIYCSDTEDLEQEANAKLIAAAPKLLEALMNIENDDGSIPEPIWTMRNEAIKQATS